MHFYTFTLVIGGITPAVAQVVATPYGFAADVTGGGSATPAFPADIEELKAWMADDEPRVIMIDKTYDFIGSEGSVTEMGCRLKDTCTAENGGQDTIKDSGCDDNEVPIEVTYDQASYLGMPVGSNKSLVGIGNQGVLLGKGLRFDGGASNIIIQNIHIDNLNPQYVWGGDAISLSNNQGVWIDHCKLSRTGRQHFVSHYDANRVTISNTEFDGVTDFSHSCDNNHYWTIIIGGSGDQITLDGNYIHDTSGRAPKIGSSEGTQLVQAVNNLFDFNSGHNFDISSSGYVLIEGNYFESSPTPITDASSEGHVFNVPSDGSGCLSALGRDCESNMLVGSGNWPSRDDETVLDEFGPYQSSLVAPRAAGEVKGYVENNAGIGRIGN